MQLVTHSDPKDLQLPLEGRTSILVVSDVHYEHGSHHGIDESGAFNWLTKTVDRVRPGALVGLGDWGYGWIKPEWNELATRCNVYTIYGNHDDVPRLKSVTNRDGSKILMEDGGIRVIAGLRFGFINGIISETKKQKNSVRRKTTEEYLEASSRLSSIDILCTHESPLVPEYAARIGESPGTLAAAEAIHRTNPWLAVSGHLSGPFTASRIGTTVSLRIDSSQAERCYAVLLPSERKVQVYHDYELVKEISEALP